MTPTLSAPSGTLTNVEASSPEALLTLERDGVQEKLAMFARLEKQFSDLIDGYEILLDERSYLSQTISEFTQLESLDDPELVSQYFKAMHDNSAVILPPLPSPAHLLILAI